MKKNYFLLLLLMISFAAQAQKNKEDKRLAGIDAELTKMLKDWNMAGFAVAVVEKDKVIYSKGFGYRDYENKKPVTDNTLFAIGSSTKAFTCGLIGLLQEDGKLSLDNKVRDYLPALHFFNDNMDATITVRDMMCHRTGLPRHDFAWYLFNSHARDSMLMRIRYLEPSAGVREAWQYNNFMFLAQGVIVEKLTGHSWEENIKSQLLSKMDMTRSNLFIKDLQQDADASLGYQIVNDSVIRKMDYYDIAGMGPAGSINSSANEMAHWLITWINDGKYKGTRVLPSAYVQDAISAQMVVGGGSPGKVHPDLHMANYGLGWFLSSYRGHYRVEHGGNIDGFSANVAFYPSDSIGIVVLTNQNESSVPALARNLIADKIMGLKYFNWSKERLDANKKEEQEGKARNTAADTAKATAVSAPASHPMKDYEGIYGNPGYGDIEVYLSHDSLYGKTPQRNFYFRHRLYDIFELKWIDKTEGVDTSAGGMPVTFRYNATGKIEEVEMPLESGVKPIVFKYKPKAKAMTKEELDKYTGIYELSGVSIKVYLKGDVLYLSVPGQPDYETIPTGNHQFAMKGLDGYSVQFEEDLQHKIAAVNFIQPNGTFKAKRKG